MIATANLIKGALFITVITIVAQTTLVERQQSWFKSTLDWFHRTPVTLYFITAKNDRLVPISRSLVGNNNQPEDVIEQLLAGSLEDSGLISPLPAGTEIRKLVLNNGLLHIDVSKQFAKLKSQQALPAIFASLTSLPTVDKVLVTIAQQAFAESNLHQKAIYFHRNDHIVAKFIEAKNPQELIERYLSAGHRGDLLGLPNDVQLLDYDYDPLNAQATLNFSFTDSLNTLGKEHPEATRNILLGIINSLTNFSSVVSVVIKFDGHSRIGLGQCASLIGVPQMAPSILNDERLINL